MPYQKSVPTAKIDLSVESPEAMRITLTGVIFSVYSVDQLEIITHLQSILSKLSTSHKLGEVQIKNKVREQVPSYWIVPNEEVQWMYTMLRKGMEALGINVIQNLNLQAT